MTAPLPGTFTRRFPHAARIAAAAEPLPLTPSRSGPPFALADGRELASAYDPVREGARFVAGQGIGAGEEVVCYGLGLGYHLPPLLDAVGPEGRLLVVEADPRLVATAAAAADPALWADPRLTLVTGDSEPPLLAAWGEAMARFGDRAKVVIHEPSFRLLPPGYAKVARTLEMIRMERRFPAVMGGRVSGNLARNLALFPASGTLAQFDGIAAGRIAVVAGAGPGLDGALPEIARLAQGTLVICADTALPALLAAGIEPSLVVTADPQEETLMHFELAGRDDLPLLAAAGAHAGLLARWRGERYFGFIDAGRYEGDARRYAERVGCFGTGGSVSALAFAAALRSGAATILLAGQDFSWPGGRGYAGGTIPSVFNAPLDRSDETMERDWFGAPVATSLRLHAYRREFERLARERPGGVKTLSARGVVLDGIEPVPSLGPVSFGRVSLPLPVPPPPPGEALAAALAAPFGKQG